MYKKLAILIIGIMVCTSFAFAVEQEWKEDPRFEPIVPEISAMGGSFAAAGEGWNSLYSNPASFSREKWSLNLLSITPTLYMRPDFVVGLANDYSNLIQGLANGQSMEQLIGGEEEVQDFLFGLGDQVLGQMKDNGLGAGLTVGTGYVGNGFGLGIINVTDFYARGSVLNVKGYVHNTTAVIVGVSFPIEIGPVTLHVGADVRPMLRIKSKVNTDMVMQIIPMPGSDNQEPFDPLGLAVQFGYGFGIDAGVIAEWGPLAVAISARDIGNTWMFYTDLTVSDALDAVENAVFPDKDDSLDYRIPMDLTFGVSFHPDMGDIKWLIDPKIHVDIRDIVQVIKDQSSFWKLLHIGAEVNILSFLNVRAGLNQGYLTAGAGVLLPGLNIYASFFTKEFEASDFVGDQPVSGMTLETAIRI